MPYQHETTIRIYPKETDAQGIVYHGNYLILAERAREEYFRSLDPDYPKMFHEAGIGYTVRHASINYFHSARNNDLVRVVTHITEMGTTSCAMISDMYVGEKHITSIKTTLVMINSSYKPTPIPDNLRAMFE